MFLIKSNDIEKSIPLKVSVKMYSDLRQKYLENNYNEFTFIENDRASNISAVIFSFPFIITYCLIAYQMKRSLFYIGTEIILINLLLEFISTPIHEAIHGFGWSRFCKNGFKSIFIYLPVNLSNAYCHCCEPLTFCAYAFGTMLPFMLLSVIPFAMSLIFQNSILFWYSIFSAVGCGSDIKNTIISYKHKQEIFLDYPTDCGFTSYRKKAEP